MPYLGLEDSSGGCRTKIFHRIAALIGCALLWPLAYHSLPLNRCAFASLADVAKGGDGAKSALREIFLALSLGFQGLTPFRSARILES